MQSCKGYCDFLNDEILCKKFGVWNRENASYCKICSQHFIYPGIFCPCCGTKLRKNPHTKEAKERLKLIEKQ